MMDKRTRDFLLIVYRSPMAIVKGLAKLLEIGERT